MNLSVYHAITTSMNVSQATTANDLSALFESIRQHVVENWSTSLSIAIIVTAILYVYVAEHPQSCFWTIISFTSRIICSFQLGRMNYVCCCCCPAQGPINVAAVRDGICSYCCLLILMLVLTIVGAVTVHFLRVFL
jgi:hypothetical protein